MANLVDRATSDMLGGPDWAMNMELCDIINNDPGHAKDAVKAVKKRLGNKNPKVQLLALTVLETMIKNCGDIVHHQVAGKDLLHEMVKIAKKNKNIEVRDRILSLIDTWQEAFGGPRGRYPQYFMAYDELRRSGVVFPRRAETASPIYTPPQTHPIASNFPSPPHSPNYTTSRTETSSPPELAGLSLTEIQNARGGMEVLMEMLNAISPGDKLALQGEVIVELVEQCRTSERRVMQLVNSTSDEELLRQGLSLNDDLKRVLRRHDALGSGAPISQDTPTAPPLLIDTHQQPDSDYGLSHLPQRSTPKPQSQTSSSANSTQVALPAPAQSQKKATALATTHAPVVDLLSGDAFVQNSESSAPVAPASSQHIQSSLLTLAQPGTSNLFGNNESFQAAPSIPSFYSSQQHQQSYPQSNGAVAGQSGVPFQHNSYSQVQQVQTQTQSVGQFPENNYIAPWAQPSGPSLSPQQQALIYGTENSTQGQSPQSQQQLALGYGAQLPSGSQPTSLQAYSSYLQPQQVYGSSQVQPQQSLSTSPYAYGSPQGQPLVGFNQQSQKSHLPPAPWSTESSQDAPPLSQQTSHFYGSANLSSLPQSPVQYPDRQQLFQQQQQQQFFAVGQLNPQITAGQFVPQIGDANLSAQMENLSFQRAGGYYSAMQSTGQYMQQAEFPFHQKQAAPMKETKPEDKLFKDLVDFSKSNKEGTSNK